MEYLPIFNHLPEIINPQVYDVNTIVEYQNFLNNLKNQIMYARAVVLNNAIVFNNYEPYTPVKTMINNIVKNNIINNPTQLLTELFNINQDGSIILYMNYEFINIHYSAINHSLTVSRIMAPDNNLYIN